MKRTIIEIIVVLLLMAGYLGVRNIQRYKKVKTMSVQMEELKRENRGLSVVLHKQNTALDFLFHDLRSAENLEELHRIVSKYQL